MSADQPGFTGVDPAMLQQITRFGQQAAQLRDIIREAQRQAPTSAAGEDASGSVRVTLAHDGLPAQIHIDRRWRSRITPAELGAATCEAAAAAAHDRLTAWSQALDAQDFRARAECVMRDDNPSLLSTPTSEIPAMFRATPGHGGPPPRRLDETAEAVMSSLGRAAEPPTSAKATGRAVRGRVTVTLNADAGLTGCTIDAEWARTASPADFDRALQTALSEARSTLRNLAPPPNSSTAADTLFTEILGFLQDPDQLS